MERVFRISYSKEYDDADLYRVTLHAINQTIVLSAGVLVKKIGMDPRCSVGCKDMSIHEIIDLGFVFPIGLKKMVI